MGSGPGDKDFIPAGIVHGFHLINDISSISSVDTTDDENDCKIEICLTKVRLLSEGT